MASGTRDLTVVPIQEGDEGSMMLDPSIQGSLQRTSSIVSENSIAVGGDLNAGKESFISVASLKNLEIIEAEADPSPEMEPSLQTTSSMPDPAEDERSSETGSTSVPKMKVNPFIDDLSRVKWNDLIKHFYELKRKLENGLQEKAVYAFLEHNNMTEVQEKVQELFYVSEAIEFIIKNFSWLLNTQILKDSNIYIKADYHRTDIYHRLFIHALSYATKLQENPSICRTLLSNSMIVDNFSYYFEATDFMVFLINKAQEEEDIMYPSLTLQENKTLVTKCVHRYEEETISTFICLVVNDEDEKAEDLFKSLLKHLKPSDIINRGRVYNYALQKAQDLLNVYKFLSSPSLSQRYKDVVYHNDRLNWFAMEYDNQVKVHRFLVDLYLRDDLKQKIDWECVEQHDYPYLIRCVWEYHKRMIIPNDVTKYKWTPLQRTYVLTSSIAITFGGIDIINHLLEAWPTLVNALYKGVAELHVVVLKGNEKVIERLLMQKELDINVRTGRLLTGDEVKNFLKYWMPPLDSIAFNKGVLKCKDESLAIATTLKDHEELIKDLLRQGEIEVTPSGYLDANKFINKNLNLEKKWSKNRWKLPTYQTALHIAIKQGHTRAVKLLCDVSKPHHQRLRCHEQDEEDHTPLDILYGEQLNKPTKDFGFSEIEKILLSKQDVQNGIERLYRNRQVLVDAMNMILVGAALIAGVTFARWLQPPLGYAQYYDLAMPYPAPPGTYDSYLAVQGNLGVKAFALFNFLSFFFAIATVIVGADAAFPTRTYQYIGHVVEIMHYLLWRAIKFLIISLVCVLGGLW